MGTASTSKKIQRVQKAGVNRRAGQSRPLGFPALVIAILVAGTILVFVARSTRVETTDESPEVGDHWHEAFGLYVCDQYLPNQLDVKLDATGIHTRGDGLIEVHPFEKKYSGKNAVMAHFLTAIGLELGDGSFTLHDGTTHKAGDSCGSGDSATTDTVVKLFVWPPQASNVTKPEIVTQTIAGTRFEQDKRIYALALVPRDTTTIDLPPATSKLRNPADADKTPVKNDKTVPTAPKAETTTTTTAPSASTTVAGETTTTVAGETTTTTTAG